MSACGIRGVIEGFYGRPWTWPERQAVMSACAGRGMTHYVHAPKDDPFHRERWRDPLPDGELAAMERFAASIGVTAVYGISPGLSITEDDPTDRAALAARVDSVLEVGWSGVCLCLDDLPPDGRAADDRGRAHGRLAAWLADHVGDRGPVIVVPVDYTGTRPTPYLDGLVRELPGEVLIAWTGRLVVNDVVTADQAEARAAACGGRPPVLWDNWPVNDGVMADRLEMGPLRGRDPALLGVLAGYLANPMVQPGASVLPLASTAAWLRGEDPVEAWAAEAGELRPFAEAVDGRAPVDLVDTLVSAGARWVGPARDLAAWVEGARTPVPPDLEPEVRPWVDQLGLELEVLRRALALWVAARPAVTVDDGGRGQVAGADVGRLAPRALALATAWRRARAGTASVLGTRIRVRPALAQDEGGAWVLDPTAVEVGSNATDRLAEAALGAARECRPGSPVEVEVDGAPVPVRDGAFTAPPGSWVTVRQGTAVTTVTAPCAPPPGDRRLGEGTRR